MNWSTIKATVKEVIESIDGLDHLGAVEWSGAAAGKARKYPRVDLSAKSVRGYGDDEQRLVDDGFGVITEYISGPRRWTLSIKVESDRASTGEALEIADRIRTRLSRNSVTDALAAAELGAADMADTQTATYQRDGREYEGALIDVFMNGVENDADTSDGAGDYIEQVSIQSDPLLNPDGEENADQIDIEVSA